MKSHVLGTLLILVSAFAFSPDVLAQAAWTPEKLLTYKDITDVELSPDGRHVAYVVREAVAEGEKSEYLQHIWIAATDGSTNRQYTRGEKSASAPGFSPDSKHLAFLSSREDDKTHLFVLPLEGGEAERITHTKGGVGSYAWSPNGKRIAFTMTDTLTADEEKANKEKRDVVLVDQQYKYSHLYTIMPADGKESLQRLTSGDMQVSDFDWSPDGRTIAFDYADAPRIDAFFAGGDIALVPADSGAVRKLVTRPGLDQSPHFSPDGNTIAFVSQGGTPDYIGLSDVYTVPVSGGSPKALAQSPSRDANILDFTADGKRILITETAGVSSTIYALAADGSELNDKPALTPASGSASNFSYNAATDVLAYVFESSNQPEELYVSAVQKLPIAASSMKAISSVNEGYADGSHGKTEVIQWTSTEDMTIEGLLTYPTAYEAGKRYPIVLQIHGGPAGVSTQRYTGAPSIYATQQFAERGYFVLKPNPRGSTGYGSEFRHANVKDWGMGDYRDLMSGVDHVIEQGMADPDRQFVMGWSYGGYMTSWVVTQTKRFKAASMGAGLPNLVSMTTTTDIGPYLEAHMGGKPFWEDFETYERHSPTYQFANVETPTQVIHGANDLRVPTAQGYEYYNSLRRKGVDTEMIVYPRTPHGPREPKFVVDVTPRILDWFAKYGGPAASTSEQQSSATDSQGGK